MLENNEQKEKRGKFDEKVLIAFIVRKMNLMETLNLFTPYHRIIRGISCD